jgi:pimeloyl-ACP methyl ester carboxylesterase
VRSVTLVDTGILPGYRWHKYGRIWRTPIVGELFTAATTRSSTRFIFNRENPRPLPRAFFDRIASHADRGHKRAVLALYRSTEAASLDKEVAPGLAAHRFPTLVLWGDGDRFIPVSYADVQKKFFDAEVHVMRDCGHWPMIDEPGLFEELVEGFLRPRLLRALPRVAGAAMD